MLASIARTLGRIEDVKRYEALAEAIRVAYVNRYFDASTGKVGPGTQASQLFALQFNMLPEESRNSALDYLKRDINTNHEGRLSTGIFGTNYLLDYLARTGHMDTAYALVNHEEWPGWGFMLVNGATTLWETWKFSDNTFSHNHPMFGSVSQWFFHHVAGIRPAPDAVGFDHAIIAPKPPPGLNHASAEYHSVRGRFESTWKRNAESFDLTIQIPIGARATVLLPANESSVVTESGKPLDEVDGLRLKKRDTDEILLGVESGVYHFTVRR
jgi:alpha-L-rhamnosidase